jgi:hypothetical protein
MYTVAAQKTNIHMRWQFSVLSKGVLLGDEPAMWKFRQNKVFFKASYTDVILYT